jgi:hypothetical protein
MSQDQKVTLTYPNIDVRVILRESADGKVKLVETTNADYAVIRDGKIEGLYEDKNNAINCYGRITRGEQ